jgi:DNA-binding response OmpR family regulator
MTEPCSPVSQVDVLVIDDDAMLRSFIVELLTRRGYAVVEAENGRDALALLDSRRFQVVITDIVMPDMEGLATIRQIRATLGTQTRIIAISGEGGDRTQYLRHAAVFGADATLEKPFAPPVLLALLEQVLSRQAGPAVPAT